MKLQPVHCAVNSITCLRGRMILCNEKMHKCIYIYTIMIIMIIIIIISSSSISKSNYLRIKTRQNMVDLARLRRKGKMCIDYLKLPTKLKLEWVCWVYLLVCKCREAANPNPSNGFKSTGTDLLVPEAAYIVRFF